MNNLAIFASGSGTNADAICNYFAGHPSVVVALIVTNKKEAGVLEIAKKRNIPTENGINISVNQSFLEEDLFITIFDISGKEIFTSFTKYLGIPISINTSGFANGMYLVKLISDDGENIESQKFIKE